MTVPSIPLFGVAGMLTPVVTHAVSNNNTPPSPVANVMTIVAGFFMVLLLSFLLQQNRNASIMSLKQAIAY